MDASEVLELGKRRSTPELERDSPIGIVLGVIAAISAICILMAKFGGALLIDDANDAVLTSTFVAAADERKAFRPDQLTHPLPCDATMRVMVGPVVLDEQCYRRRVQ